MCGLTFSFAQCNRKWMVVVCAEPILALENLLRQFADPVDSGLARFRRSFAGNAAYQLRASGSESTSGSGRSDESRQHR